MAEIEQEELERLREFETKYNQLNDEHEKLKGVHDKLKGEHETLKNDYVSLSNGQLDKGSNTADDFDILCAKKFGKNK